MADRARGLAILDQPEVGVDDDVRVTERDRLVQHQRDRRIVEREGRLHARAAGIDRKRLIERERLVVTATQPVRDRAGDGGIGGRLGGHQRRRVIDIRDRAAGALHQDMELELGRRAFIDDIERADRAHRLDDRTIQAGRVEDETHAVQSRDRVPLPPVLMERCIPLEHSAVQRIGNDPALGGRYAEVGNHRLQLAGLREAGEEGLSAALDQLGPERFEHRRRGSERRRGCHVEHHRGRREAAEDVAIERGIDRCQIRRHCRRVREIDWRRRVLATGCHCQHAEGNVGTKEQPHTASESRMWGRT